MDFPVDKLHKLTLPQFDEFIGKCTEKHVSPLTNEHGYSRMVFYDKPEYGWFEYMHKDEDYHLAVLRLYWRICDAAYEVKKTEIELYMTNANMGKAV